MPHRARGAHSSGTCSPKYPRVAQVRYGESYLPDLFFLTYIYMPKPPKSPTPALDKTHGFTLIKERFIDILDMAASVKDLIASLDGLPSDISDVERMQLKDALRRNIHRLQTPFERTWEMTLAQPHLYAAIKTTIDLGIWEAWRSVSGGEKSLDELVNMCKKDCEPNLLREWLPFPSTIKCTIHQITPRD